MGEVTFLAFTHRFEGASVISGWSSGTGAAGVIGAGSFAALTSLGLAPRTTVLIMVVVPLGMALSFWGLLKPDESTSRPIGIEDNQPLLEEEEDTLGIIEDNDEHRDAPPPLTVIEKLVRTKSLLKYMIPLGLVYYFEYLINQGLYELLYFPTSGLSHSQQYR